MFKIIAICILIGIAVYVVMSFREFRSQKRKKWDKKLTELQEKEAILERQLQYQEHAEDLVERSKELAKKEYSELDKIGD